MGKVQIFGSEELSAKSSTIQKRMTDAYVALAPSDAKKLGIQQGTSVSINDSSVAVACIREQIAEGNCVIYSGDQLNPHDIGSTAAIAKSDTPASGRGITGLIVSDLLEESY